MRRISIGRMESVAIALFCVSLKIADSKEFTFTSNIVFF